MVGIMQMLTSVVALALALTLALTATGLAHADVPSGRYEVTVSVVSNSCEDAGATLRATSSLELTRTGSTLQASLSGTPTMTGTLRRRGKFRLAGKTAKASAAGVSGNFKATGRVESDEIRLVLVAEYYKGGKAQCTQSWDVAGTKR